MSRKPNFDVNVDGQTDGRTDERTNERTDGQKFGLLYRTCLYSRCDKNQQFAYAKTKRQISFAVTAKLISAFVFATRLVRFLFFLNPKFPVSSHLLCLYSLVCVGPGRNLNCWFSQAQAHVMISEHGNAMVLALFIRWCSLEVQLGFYIQSTVPLMWRQGPTLEGLHIGKTTTVFPGSLLSFHFTALFAYINQAPSISPCTAVAKLGTLLISTAIPRPPLGWGHGYK